MLIWAGMEFLVPRAVKAREQLLNAFVTYHRGDHSDAAEVIKQRAMFYQEYGVPDEDIARTHMIFSQGVMPNTVPTAFWSVFDIYSRPDLLRRLRRDIEGTSITRDKTNGNIELDVAALKTRCPLLLACLEETQRVSVTVHS